MSIISIIFLFYIQKKKFLLKLFSKSLRGAGAEPLQKPSEVPGRSPAKNPGRSPGKQPKASHPRRQPQKCSHRKSPQGLGPWGDTHIISSTGYGAP